MNGPQDRSQWLADLLHDEASRHEPDRASIWRMIEEREAAEQSLPPRRPAARSERAAPAPGRRRFAWPVAAAAVTALTMATVAGARTLVPTPDQAGTPIATTSGDHVLGPPLSIATSATDTPGASRTTPATSTRGPAATVTAPTATAPAHPGTSVTGAVSIRVTPTADGTRLVLPRDGDRDWILTGSRADGRTIRAKRPTRPLGSVTVSGYGPAIVDGPYQISFTGGAPEQSRDGDHTWQSITAVDGRLRVTVPLRGDRFTVDLFTGTIRAAGEVSVQVLGSDAEPARGRLEPCGRDVCATVVSVVVDGASLPGGGSGELAIDLGPADPGAGLGIGLAAVVLH